MKTVYQKPTMNVVQIQHQSHILAGSAGSVKSLNSGDTGITYGGGGSGPAHSRSNDDWDDDWDE